MLPRIFLSISIVIVAERLVFLKSNSTKVSLSFNCSKTIQPNWSLNLLTDKLIEIKDLHSFSILHRITPIDESKEQALKLILEEDPFRIYMKLIFNHF